MEKLIGTNSFDIVLLGDAVTGLPYTAGAGGGGGAVTIADGADATLGAKADSAATTDTGTFSVVAFIKRGLQNWTSLLAKIPALGAAAKAASIPVTLATDQPAISVVSSNPAAVITGQTKIAVTGTAVQLPSNALVNGIVVKSLSTNNAAKQTVGAVGVTNTTDGTGNGYILNPGEAASISTTNSNAVYVNGTVGDIFTFEGN